MRRTEDENFFRREEISRVPGGAVESGRSSLFFRTVACFPRASPSCGRFPQAPREAGGLRKPGSILLGSKDFLPIGMVGGEVVWCCRGWRAKILMG